MAQINMNDSQPSAPPENEDFAWISYPLVSEHEEMVNGDSPQNE
jgi:hypothetical protein